MSENPACREKKSEKTERKETGELDEENLSTV